ncbi:MAG TPA: c-type cytochrome [Anaeromyxobacteraceae bacterium]|nr:c-type cytochrome [Anaeromyxobacteraceae bacterium]
MTEGQSKAIFWIGTLSSAALFLGLTFDTQREFDRLTHADKLDAQVVAGKRAFEARNCNDCHTILGFGGYYAPDLTRAFDRIGAEGIRRRLADPAREFRASYRKMPKQALGAQEMDDLVAFLRWTGGIENNDWPPQDSQRAWKRSTERLLAGALLSPGAALLKQENCLACHALGDGGERIGPRLEWIGGKRDAAWIAELLRDPQRLQPDTPMPSFAHLDQGQRLMIGELVVSLAARGRMP